MQFIFIAPVKNEAFFVPVKRGMNNAAEMLNVECLFTGTEGVDLDAQAEMVRQAVDDGYDGIALDIIDPVAFDAAVQEAMDKGVPVVAFNVDDNNSPNARLSAVCQKFYEAGRSLGEASLSFIPPGSRILLTYHDENISALEERSRGIQDALQQKNITFKEVRTTNNPSEAFEIISKKLKNETDIRFIVGTGLTDTEAAGKVIAHEYKDQGYAVSGFDLSEEILDLIKEGIIKFTVDQQPYVQGFFPVVQLTLYRRYGIMPSSIDAGAAIIGENEVETVRELSKRGIR